MKTATVREITAKLKADGWVEKAQKGSHLQFTHPTKAGKVTVPNHKGDIPIMTFRSIYRQAGWKWPP